MDRTRRRVLAAIDALDAPTQADFGTAEVLAMLREAQAPMGAWEVRGALTALERDGWVACDAATARWRRLDARRESA
jgi:hypothetical protein